MKILALTRLNALIIWFVCLNTAHAQKENVFAPPDIHTTMPTGTALEVKIKNVRHTSR